MSWMDKYVIPGILWAGVAVFAAMVIMPFYAKAATINVYQYNNSSDYYIAIDGELDKGDDVILKRTIQLNQHRARTVHFDSPGGYVYVGWEMAKIIRESGFNTAVGPNNECSSACTYAFMGGKKRFANYNADFGFHPAWIEDFSGSDISKSDIYDMGQTDALNTIMNYAYYVEVNREWDVINFINEVYRTTDFRGMYWASTSQLMDANIATDTY